MTRSTVGETLAAQLHKAEETLDTALREAAVLAAMLPQARVDAYLSAVTGQRAVEGVAATVSNLTQARGHLVGAHNSLSAIARALGLNALALGPVDKPEDTPPIGDGPDRFTNSPQTQL